MVFLSYKHTSLSCTTYFILNIYANLILKYKKKLQQTYLNYYSFMFISIFIIYITKKKQLKTYL